MAAYQDRAARSATISSAIIAETLGSREIGGTTTAWSTGRGGITSTTGATAPTPIGGGPATWGLATGWLAGNWGQPIYYDYGNNVVYRDNYVYVNDVPIAPADVYADQAINLANAPPPPEGTSIDWMPLGTFGLASTQDNTQPDVVLQLAISKEGLVSGTSYNSANQTENTVSGRVDPTTQRLAIHFGDDDNIVLETGLYNLTQDSTPVLIHFGTLTTQTWFLVRLQAPAEVGQ